LLRALYSSDARRERGRAREVNLSSSGELDVSSAKSTSQIKATVRIAGASSLPSDLQIVLRSSKGK